MLFPNPGMLYDLMQFSKMWFVFVSTYGDISLGFRTPFKT
jgi:hypothetical protein